MDMKRGNYLLLSVLVDSHFIKVHLEDSLLPTMNFFLTCTSVLLIKNYILTICAKSLL